MEKKLKKVVQKLMLMSSNIYLIYQIKKSRYFNILYSLFKNIKHQIIFLKEQVYKTYLYYK